MIGIGPDTGKSYAGIKGTAVCVFVTGLIASCAKTNFNECEENCIFILVVYLIRSVLK